MVVTYNKIFFGKYDDLLTAFSSLIVKDCIKEVQFSILPLVNLNHIIDDLGMQLVITFD